MLSSVEGKGGDGMDHPMADDVEARRIIAAFPADDSIKAAQEAVRWLESITQTEGFPLARRYELIDLIDMPLKRHGQNLLERYLSIKPQLKFQEVPLWKVAMNYYKALGDAYLACVAQAEANKDAAGAFRKALPRLAARAIRAQMSQIKWMLMRYDYVSESHWQTLAWLHNYAEAGQFVDEEMDVYGESRASTVRQEFLRTLMLGVSSTGGLSPVKQNIAERAIAYFSNAFLSGSSAASGLNFVFDLNGSMPPSRVLANPPPGTQRFYFGAGSALDGAQKVIDAINDTGALLSGISLGPGENIDQMSDTLLHLAFNWEIELPPRDSERHRVSAKLQVAQGVDGILAQAKGAASETWTVENVSEEGYGAIVPEQCGEWLQVGVLIGVRAASGSAAWGAGVVRRVETDARGQRRVGIQVLSRAVAPATMCALSASGARGAPRDVILLDAEPSQSGYLLAVLRPETFTLREALEATRTADGKTFVLMPSGMVESGPDFEKVRFKMA